MKEYGLGIHTNIWNALRYFCVTLMLIPFAEKFWTRVHSRRTGTRLRRGYTARLAKSKLAYWGLHQEVDENSRLSRVLAIAVCVLHITGTLLLEYGSGSKKTYNLRDAVVSRTLRDDGQLRANGVYFFDAGYILGKPYGSAECIDGGPRNLSDLGLVSRVLPVLKVVSSNDIRIPQGKAHVKVEYGLRKSGQYFQMYENGSTRWYGHNNETYWNAPSDSITVFVNETLACWRRSEYLFECIKNNGKIEHTQLLSDALALSAIRGISFVNRLWRQQSRRVGVDLNRVSVVCAVKHLCQAAAHAHTKWIRRGMPRKEAPSKTSFELHLDVNSLQEGCEHPHAVPVSNLHRLRGLKVSKPNYPVTKHVWSGDRKLVVWLNGNNVVLGTLAQMRNDYCSALGIARSSVRLCITNVDGRRHELALYVSRRSLRSSEEYLKFSNFSIYGALRKEDTLDLAIQCLVEGGRLNHFSIFTSLDETQKRVIKLIESGKAVSGLVRLAGNGVQGKSVLKESETATLNILGIVGAAILALLVCMPIPMLFAYTQAVEANVESSYRRAVMEIHGVQNYLEVPDRAPSIIAEAVNEGKSMKISHTYRM